MQLVNAAVLLLPSLYSAGPARWEELGRSALCMICFMYDLHCLPSKRRLFLCRWMVILKNAPWWPTLLISSLSTLRYSQQTTSTPEQSHLLLCNCMEQSVLLLCRGLRHGEDFVLDCIQIDFFSRFLGETVTLWTQFSTDSVLMLCKA